MRRALPLLLLTLVAAGCGGRTYSDADIQHAFAGFHLRKVPAGVPAAYHPTFATWAAVTELRIDEGSATPVAYYSAADVEIVHYRTPYEAAVGSHVGPIAIVGLVGRNPEWEVEQRGNLVVFVSGRRRQVEAAVARLP